MEPFEPADWPRFVRFPAFTRDWEQFGLSDAALRALVRELLPLARIITPNLPEAERMTGLPIRDEAGLLRAAHALRDLGARAVLVKGGHLPGRAEHPEAVDILVEEDGATTILRGAWIESRDTHGTGCTLAAALAAYLAHGADLLTATRRAKAFVAAAIRQAPGLGHGHGPVQHTH